MRNYTSQISAQRSIAWIEAKLAQHKATQILKLYSPEGTVTAVAFIVKIDGMDMPFRLPARVDACERALKARCKRPQMRTLNRIKQQAERTAWKIIADWVDVQMTMIELAQVELLEVFLPYVYDHAKQQTYFERIKERGYQALLPAAVENKS